jgi:hypothetical protein
MRSEVHLPRRARGLLGAFLVVSTLQFVGVLYVYKPLVLLVSWGAAGLVYRRLIEPPGA